jgi:hypothetical protein
MRKKRSDTGVKRIYNSFTDSTYSIRERSEIKPENTPFMELEVKPSDAEIIINALRFIENFEASGEEYIWIEGLKQVLQGKP